MEVSGADGAECAGRRVRKSLRIKLVEVPEDLLTSGGAVVQSLELELPRSSSVGDIKRALAAARSGGESGELRAYFRGHLVADSWRPATSAGFVDGDTLVLMRGARACGGPLCPEEHERERERERAPVAVVGLASLAQLPEASQRAQGELLSEVREGLEAGQRPELSAEGSGGTYFLKDRRGRRVACFKPCDEEPTAANNPRGESAAVRGAASRDGVLAGEAVLREVAAFVTDAGSFSGVPETMLVEIAHESFSYKVRGSPLAPKVGSLQRYVAGESAGNFSPQLFPVDEVHKIGILDIRMLNADRNDANLLVSRRPKRAEGGRRAPQQRSCSSNAADVDAAGNLAQSAWGLCAGAGADADPDVDQRPFHQQQHEPALALTPRLRSKSVTAAADYEYSLTPIDHGFCLPDRLSVSWCDLCWLDWPQARQPFSERTLEWLRAYDVEECVSRLRRELDVREPCLALVRAAGMLLKMGAAAGLCLHDIASILVRQDIDSPSVLEKQVQRAHELSAMMRRNARTKAPPACDARHPVTPSQTPRRAGAGGSSRQLQSPQHAAAANGGVSTSDEEVGVVLLQLPRGKRQAASTPPPPPASAHALALAHDTDQLELRRQQEEAPAAAPSLRAASHLLRVNSGTDLHSLQSQSCSPRESFSGSVRIVTASTAASTAASSCGGGGGGSGGSISSNSNSTNASSASTAGSSSSSSSSSCSSCSSCSCSSSSINNNNKESTFEVSNTACAELRRFSSTPPVELPEEMKRELLGVESPRDASLSTLIESAPKERELLFFGYLERLLQDVILCVQQHRKSDNALFRRASSQRLTSPHRGAAFFAPLTPSSSEESECGNEAALALAMSSWPPAAAGRECGGSGGLLGASCGSSPSSRSPPSSPSFSSSSSMSRFSRSCSPSPSHSGSDEAAGSPRALVPAPPPRAGRSDSAPGPGEVEMARFRAIALGSGRAGDAWLEPVGGPGDVTVGDASKALLLESRKAKARIEPRGAPHRPPAAAAHGLPHISSSP